MKIIKGFQNMGTVVKLLFKQLVSFSALCAISSISPPPISCAENKICRVDFPCACGKCVPFRRHFVPVGFVPQPNQHFILPALQAYTSAPHSLGEILISIPQATFIPFSPKLFSNANPMVYFIFCGVFAPIKNYKSISIKK
jgi:hypothetical protein